VIKNQEVMATAANQAVVLEPLAAKVDNPLFNPMFFLNEPLKEEVKKNVEAANLRQHRLSKTAQLAVRNLSLPEIMSPVAIQNLRELEKNMNSVSKDMKKTWFANFPRQMKLAQEQAFTAQNLFTTRGQLMHLDSIRFSNTFTTNTELNWASLGEELKASQKAIEDAMKKGKISQVDAKKILAEIAKSLKEVKFPQVYSYAPGAVAGNQFYWKQGEEDNSDEKRDNLKTEERKRVDLRDRLNGTRIKRPLPDSLKQKLVTKTIPSVPSPAQVHGYMAIADHIPYFVMDNSEALVSYYTNGTNKPATIKGSVRAKSDKNNEASTYSYSYTENGEECDQANQTERNRKSYTIPVRIRSQKNVTKTATATVKKGTSIQVVVTPPKPEMEPLIIEVE
jgi:hypothetical protein